MRRAMLAAVILVLALAAPVQGAPRVALVTGDYAYAYLDNVPAVTITGRASDPATGWVWYAGDYATFGGPVQCVQVDGADAWLAGPVAVGSSGFEGYDGWAVRVHDGGAPGRAGDLAITFIDTPEAVLEICASGRRSTTN